MSSLTTTTTTALIATTPQTFIPKPHFPLTNTSFSFRQNNRHFICKSLTANNSNSSSNIDLTRTYPKPTEIPWQKELANNIQLIGNVGLPINILQLSSGKVVAKTRLAVWQSSTETTWVNLTFWDDLAYTAYQHVEKGQKIYVSGRLVSDNYKSEDGKPQTIYKVVVQQLNLVERNPAFAETNSPDDGSSYTEITKRSSQELWQAFFANPMDWWDNRRNKKNPRGPDFKHKDTGEALWIDSKFNPSWVESQLEILDSRMQASQQQEDGGLFNYL